MSNLEEFKERMRTAPDHGRPGTEWDIVKELLANPPEEFDSILEWIFAEHIGYTEPRVWAGVKFLERNPSTGWAVLEHLLASDDSDDVDTAIWTLEQSGDKSKLFLAKPLLQDPSPYIQFQVTQLLKETFPQEVETVLRALMNHESVKIREEAEKQLTEMKKSYDGK